MKFEDWFWYDSHTMFEYQINQFTGCFKGRNKGGLLFRRFLAFIMTLWSILCYYNNINNHSSPINDLKFFTIWGRYLTWFTLLAGSFVNNSEIEPIEDLNYQDRDFLRNKYSPFRAWKWYTFLFQLTLQMELIIVPFFWILLNNPSVYKPGNLAFNIQQGGDHSFLFLLLVIDYFSNCVPFCGRHFIMVNFISLIYLIINFTVSKLEGYPIYGPLDWNSVIGFILPAILLIAAGLIFCLMKYVS